MGSEVGRKNRRILRPRELFFSYSECVSERERERWRGKLVRGGGNDGELPARRAYH